MNILIKLITLAIYPCFLISITYLVLSKKTMLNSLKTNFKAITYNSLIFISLLIIAVLIFFKFEDTIYFYDYSGYWIRSLEFKALFHNNPFALFNKLYQSMLYDDYSYLVNLFLMPLMSFKDSFKYFIIANILSFLLPLSILIQIVYFHYFKNKYLILSALILFYPLYFSLFNGDVALSGVLVFAVILIIINFDFNFKDAFSLNFLIFTLIFLRRWFLFLAISIYLLLLIKLIINKYSFKKIIALLLTSTIFLSLIIFIFFKPFLLNLLTNNLKEAYQYYNRSFKYLEFINFYSPIMLLMMLYALIKYKNLNIILLLLNIIIPYLLFTNIQALEYHHYHLFNLQLFILLILALNKTWKLKLILIPILSLQILLMPFNLTLPLLTTIKRKPLTLEYKQAVIDLSQYLVSISPNTWQSSYLASGSAILNDDMIRNALLPNINDKPKIDSAILDLRDGFPKDLKHISYVIVVEPIQYLNADYQKIYKVISEAIVNDSPVSKIYQKLKSFEIADLKVHIYQRTQDFNDEIKHYFYQKMIEFYPYHQEFFKHILD